MHDLPKEEICFNDVPEKYINTCFYYEFIRELARENRIRPLYEWENSHDYCDSHEISYAHHKLATCIPSFLDKSFIELMQSKFGDFDVQPEEAIPAIAIGLTFEPARLIVFGESVERLPRKVKPKAGRLSRVISFDWRHSDTELAEQFKQSLKELRPEEYKHVNNVKPSQKSSNGSNIGLFKRTALKYLGMYRVDKYAESICQPKADIRPLYYKYFTENQNGVDESHWRKGIREVKETFDKLISGEAL